MNNQRKVIVLFIMLFFSVSIFGQKQLIILKDSSLIIGQVLNSSDDIIVIKEGEEVHNFNKTEILEVCQVKSSGNYLNSKSLSYFNVSDIGMLAGKRDGYEKYSFSFNMINGIQFGYRASAGLGFGIEFMDINLIPLFADLRWNINSGKTRLFVGMQGGFVFPLERNTNDMVWDDFNYKRGYFYNPMIGIKANFNDSRNAFVITFGFRHMDIVGERWDDWWLETKYEREFIYDRLSFRVGYYFN